MFGIFKRACRQMDAPLVVCYCVRAHPPTPTPKTPTVSQSSLLSHDRGQGKVRKCRRLVWLIWLRKKRQRPAVCTLGTDRASGWTTTTTHTYTHTKMKMTGTCKEANRFTEVFTNRHCSLQCSYMCFWQTTAVTVLCAVLTGDLLLCSGVGLQHEGLGPSTRLHPCLRHTFQ